MVFKNIFRAREEMTRCNDDGKEADLVSKHDPVAFLRWQLNPKP